MATYKKKGYKPKDKKEQEALDMLLWLLFMVAIPTYFNLY